MLDKLFPWQEALWQQLTTQANYAHAYLLHGRLGIGKYHLATRLAYYWLCLTPENNQPCGHCRSCHLLQSSGAHPDIFYLRPEESDFIKVDQVRLLIDFINQTPQMSSCKVVLLEPAEALNLNAANALLKSLEEPAGNSRLLLVSHQSEQLLPTIKSRCIQQFCPLPTKKEALEWLQKHLPDVQDEQLVMLWQLAGEAPLYALRLQKEGILEKRQQVVSDMKKLFKHQVVVSQIAENWTDVSLLLLLNWFCDWIHAILSYQVSRDESVLGLADMAQVLVYLADKSSPERVRSLQDRLLQERQAVLRKANLNRVLLLESLLINWINLMSKR